MSRQSSSSSNLRRNLFLTILGAAILGLFASVNSGIAQQGELAEASGRLSALPRTVRFPKTLVGTTSAPETVTIKNTTSSAVTVNSVTSDDAEFTPDQSCVGKALAAKSGTCKFGVTFTPADVGKRSGTWTIGTSSGSLTGALIGVGFVFPQKKSGLSARPNPLKFPDTLVGAMSAPMTVTVSNGTKKPVTVTSVSSSAKAEFAIAPDACSNAVLPAGGNCGVGVIFTPAEKGIRGAQLTIESTADKAGSKGLIVAMAGKGVAPANATPTPTGSTVATPTATSGGTATATSTSKAATPTATATPTTSQSATPTATATPQMFACDASMMVGMGNSPIVTCLDSSTCAVVTNDQNNVVKASKSSDGGITWGPLFSIGSGSSFPPAAAYAPNGDLGVAINRLVVTSNEIDYVTVPAGSTTANTPVTIAPGNGSPAVATVGFILVIAYQDGSGGVTVATSPFSVNFNEVQIATKGSSPDVAVDGLKIAVFFETFDSMGRELRMVVFSTDGGKTFSTPVPAFTGGANQSPTWFRGAAIGSDPQVYDSGIDFVLNGGVVSLSLIRLTGPFGASSGGQFATKTVTTVDPLNGAGNTIELASGPLFVLGNAGGGVTLMSCDSAATSCKSTPVNNHTTLETVFGAGTSSNVVVVDATGTDSKNQTVSATRCHSP